MNVKTKRVFISGVAFSLWLTPAFAHHSPSSEFSFNNTITLSGKVSSVDWINPHVYVHLDVKDRQGKVTTWNLETLPTRFLHKSGVSKESLMGADGAGQSVTVQVYPAKDGSK